VFLFLPCSPCGSEWRLPARLPSRGLTIRPGLFRSLHAKELDIASEDFESGAHVQGHLITVAFAAITDLNSESWRPDGASAWKPEPTRAGISNCCSDRRQTNTALWWLKPDLLMQLPKDFVSHGGHEHGAF